ncbi:MAG: hypothetical protein WA463_07665 [Terriglobales bacterium]
MIEAKVTLTRPEGTSRQFEVTTGSGHRLLVDDAAGATGPKPIELVAADCSVGAMIAKTAQLATTFEIVPARETVGASS